MHIRQFKWTPDNRAQFFSAALRGASSLRPACAPVCNGSQFGRSPSKSRISRPISFSAAYSARHPQTNGMVELPVRQFNGRIVSPPPFLKLPCSASAGWGNNAGHGFLSQLLFGSFHSVALRHLPFLSCLIGSSREKPICQKRVYNQPGPDTYSAFTPSGDCWRAKFFSAACSAVQRTCSNS